MGIRERPVRPASEATAADRRARPPHLHGISEQEAMEELISVVQRLSLSRSLEEVTSIVRVAARELTGADGATFVLRDHDECFYVDEYAISPLWKGRHFPMSSCISGWVMLNRKPAVIENVYEDPRIPIEVYRPTFVRSLVMVPIRTLGPIGAIGNYWANPHRPTAKELKLLQALADTTALALENVQVYRELEQRVRQRTEELEAANQALRNEMSERAKVEEEVRRLSLTDELTGLDNRRGFFERAKIRLRTLRESGTQAWLIFADVDGLKQVNDTLGHEAGDDLIFVAGSLLQESLRQSDIISRFGGDEFAILAVVDDDKIDALKERLQQRIEDFNRYSNRPYTVSISVGAVSIRNVACDSLDKLIARADETMYQHKRVRRVNGAGFRSGNGAGNSGK